ncbi:MAG: phosphomannomutase [Pseudomonadota bacterium]
MSQLTCFKAYDIRGRVPDELNEDIAARIGRAFVEVEGARRVAIGHDIRLSSPRLAAALSDGLRAAGADVLDVGQCGTEEIYFAASSLDVDGGIVVTASHNPMDYNGMKLVRRDAKPVSGDSGLHEIQALVEAGRFDDAVVRGSYELIDARPAYVEHLLTYVDREKLKPLKLVVNAGNGGAGAVIDALAEHLPFEFVRVHHEPDGHFPNGVPNPLLEENRAPTIEAVQRGRADMGIAWDGDFDRCFLFDAEGSFIEGYYIVGLLAEAFLKDHPGEKIVHDPRLTWNTVDIVEAMGGVPVESKTGHAFIKERMRSENALYGGEMSAHHYFRDFAYCDSGMIPWLLVSQLICASGMSLAELVADRQARFPCSGEINSVVEDPAALIAAVERRYEEQADQISRIDGLSMTFDGWRFNLRMSNTEPVLRLNVESRGNQTLMEEKLQELLAMIRGDG